MPNGNLGVRADGRLPREFNRDLEDRAIRPEGPGGDSTYSLKTGTGLPELTGFSAGLSIVKGLASASGLKGGLSRLGANITDRVTGTLATHGGLGPAGAGGGGKKGGGDDDKRLPFDVNHFPVRASISLFIKWIFTRFIISLDPDYYIKNGDIEKAIAAYEKVIRFFELIGRYDHAAQFAVKLGFMVYHTPSSKLGMGERSKIIFGAFDRAYRFYEMLGKKEAEHTAMARELRAKFSKGETSRATLEEQAKSILSANRGDNKAPAEEADAAQQVLDAAVVDEKSTELIKILQQATAVWTQQGTAKDCGDPEKLGFVPSPVVRMMLKRAGSDIKLELTGEERDLAEALEKRFIVKINEVLIIKWLKAHEDKEHPDMVTQENIKKAIVVLRQMCDTPAFKRKHVATTNGERVLLGSGIDEGLRKVFGFETQELLALPGEIPLDSVIMRVLGRLGLITDAKKITGRGVTVLKDQVLDYMRSPDFKEGSPDDNSVTDKGIVEALDYVINLGMQRIEKGRIWTVLGNVKGKLQNVQMGEGYIRVFDVPSFSAAIKEILDREIIEWDGWKGKTSEAQWGLLIRIGRALLEKRSEGKAHYHEDDDPMVGKVWHFDIFMLSTVIEEIQNRSDIEELVPILIKLHPELQQKAETEELGVIALAVANILRRTEFKAANKVRGAKGQLLSAAVNEAYKMVGTSQTRSTDGAGGRATDRIQLPQKETGFEGDEFE